MRIRFAVMLVMVELFLLSPAAQADEARALSTAEGATTIVEALAPPEPIAAPDDVYGPLPSGGGAPLAPLLGSLRVLVIPVWFSQGTVGITDPSGAIPTSVFTKILHTNPTGMTLANWFREASFGQVSLAPSTVTPWLRLARAAPDFQAGTCQPGPAGEAFVQDAIQTASLAGYPATGFDRVVVVASDSTCTTFTGVAMTAISSVLILHAALPDDTMLFTFAHELLHTYDLGHANSRDCGVGMIPVPDGVHPLGTCTHIEYGDHTSVMGRMDPSSTPAHHPSAPEKHALGWIQQSHGDVEIIPLSSLTTSWTYRTLYRSNDRSSHPILLGVDHDVVAPAGRMTWLELRGPFAASGLPAPYTFEPMASVWDGSAQPWIAGVTIRSQLELIDSTPASVFAPLSADDDFVDAPLTVAGGTVVTSPSNQKWMDPVEIDAVSVNNTSMVVGLRRPPALPVPLQPVACMALTDLHPGMPDTSMKLDCAAFEPSDTIRIDWGDGTPVQALTGLFPGMPILHHYGPAASTCYTVSLTVVDGSGLYPSASTSQVIVRGRAGRPACAPATPVSGNPLANGDQPWLASIRFGTYHACAGALVDDDLVVTTTTCIFGAFGLGLSIAPQDIDVVLGTASLGPEAPTAEHHAVSTVEWAPATLPGLLDNDLVLIRLALPTSIQPIALNADPARPALCTPKSDQEEDPPTPTGRIGDVGSTTTPKSSSKASVVGGTESAAEATKASPLSGCPMTGEFQLSGWGDSFPFAGGHWASSVVGARGLHGTRPASACTTVHQGTVYVPTAGIFCGAPQQASSIGCSGDNGSPAVQTTSNGTRVLVGLLSVPGHVVAPACGQRNWYVRIEPHVPWIMSRF